MSPLNALGLFLLLFVALLYFSLSEANNGQEVYFIFFSALFALLLSLGAYLILL